MVPYLRAANVKDGRLDLRDIKEMDFTPAEQVTFALAPGDVLVTEGAGSLAAVGASAAWSGEIDGTVCLQNTLLRLRPTPGNDPRFLMWWARHAYGSGLFAAAAAGANIYHLGAETIRTLPAAVPPINEQRAIADYLDAETARIDSVIDARLLQLAAINERVDSQVFRLTTKGLTEQALRDSGLDWAGWIPRGWGLPPVGANFEVQLGKMLNPEATADGDQFPYLRNVNVQWDRIDTDDLNSMHFDAADRKRYVLHAGDLLVCEGGEVGRAAVWQGGAEECYYQKALHRVRPRTSAAPRFLMYALWAASKQGVFQNEGNTSTIVHLTAEKLRAYRFPWPPQPEQDAIVASLDWFRAENARLTRAVQRQIDLLSERRQTLITAVVTGQIEIPGVAA